MSKGLFITVEGPDGSGKTTQLRYIKSYLEERNIEALYTREPGGTPISEKIRDVILDQHNTEMDPMTEALLYAASRAQLAREVIKPALDMGKTVICDRFVDSSIAYQGYARGLGESVSVINTYAIAGCMPDATFLFALPAERGMARLGGEQDRMEREGVDFQRKVIEGYEKLAEQFPERIIRIDASKSIEEIKTEIEGHLEILFRRKAD